MADILNMREIDQLLSSVSDENYENTLTLLTKLVYTLYKDKKLDNTIIETIKYIKSKYTDKIFIQNKLYNKNLNYNTLKYLKKYSVNQIDFEFLKSFVSKFIDKAFITIYLYDIDLLLYEIDQWDGKTLFSLHLQKHYKEREYEFDTPIYSNFYLYYFSLYANEFGLEEYAIKRKEYNNSVNKELEHTSFNNVNIIYTIVNGDMVDADYFYKDDVSNIKNYLQKYNAEKHLNLLLSAGVIKINDDTSIHIEMSSDDIYFMDNINGDD